VATETYGSEFVAACTYVEQLVIFTILYDVWCSNP